MYNQPQLRYDPTRLQHPLIQVTLGYPPYTPNVQGMPAVIQNLPLITSMAIMDIQQKAHMNSLRTFMFNQFAQNNFMTPDLEMLVDACVRYIELGLAKRQYNSVEEAIADCVPRTVEMICALALQQNPGLEQYVDPHTQAAAYRLIQTFRVIGDEINALRQAQQGGQRGFQRPVQTDFSGGGGGPYGGAFGGSGVMTHRGGSHGGFSTIGVAPMTRPTVGSGGLFNNPGNNAPSTSSNAPQAGGRYDSSRYAVPAPDAVTARQEEIIDVEARKPLTQPFSPRTPQEIDSMQNTQQGNVLDNVNNEPVAIPYKEADFRPTSQHPYFPAFTPSKFTLHYTLNTDGSTTPVVRQKSEEQILDYDKHAITTAFGTMPKRLEVTKHLEMLERVQRGVQTMRANQNATSGAGGEVDLSELSGHAPDPKATYVLGPWLSEHSLEAAWVVADIERTKRNAEAREIPDIFRVYAEVNTVVAGEVNETALVRELGEATTFVQLRNLINERVNSMSPQLLGELEKRLTDMVNRILAQNMSMPEVSIDSFLEDIEDVAPHLERNYGEIAVSAFLRHQRQHIVAAVHAPDDEHAKVMASNLLEAHFDDAEQGPPLTFIGSSYSLTLLNVVSHALDLELNEKGASMVSKALTPMMFDLVTTLFAEADNPERANFPIDRHLIRTADGRLLEATTGYIGESAKQKFYLLTLVE